MDRYKITLTPLSPFLIGGHQVANNHYETLDYIPAPTLQAAFARSILESHGEYDVRDKQQRYFIDEGISIEGCEPQWRSWLKLFSQLHFTDATPFGQEQYAPTTYGCKVDAAHPTVDLLQTFYLNRQENQRMKAHKCASHDCGERLERKNGWRWPENKRLFRRTLTRVAIDEQRHVAADGQLFSMRVGEPYADRNRSELQFVAYVSVPTEVAQGNDLQIRDELIRVGKHLTVGLGKMRVYVERLELEPFPEQRMKQWQEQVGDGSVPLMINSHLPFPFAEQEHTEYDDIVMYHRQLTQWLQETMHAPSEVSVTFAYTQQALRRSFKQGQMERKEQIDRYLSPGSLLVVDSSDEQRLREWLERIHQEGMHVATHSSIVTIAPEFCLQGGEA